LPNPSITDWLTSGATIATAIGAGLAAWVTFLGYRLAIRRASPVIEPDIYWISSADTGRCLQIHLTVKNRLDETLRLGRLSIKTPKGCLISLGRWEPQGDNLFPARGDAAFLDLANAPRPDYREVGPNRESRPILFVCPPSGWAGGKFRAEVRISTKAFTIRDRRIAIQSVVQPDPKMQTDAKASNTG
jgi:hypothetical protein